MNVGYAGEYENLHTMPLSFPYLLINVIPVNIFNKSMTFMMNYGTTSCCYLSNTSRRVSPTYPVDIKYQFWFRGNCCRDNAGAALLTIYAMYVCMYVGIVLI